MEWLTSFIDNRSGEELSKVIDAREDTVAAVAARQGLRGELAGVSSPFVLVACSTCVLCSDCARFNTLWMFHCCGG
jgi:hypothetical protein